MLTDKLLQVMVAQDISSAPLSADSIDAGIGTEWGTGSKINAVFSIDLDVSGTGIQFEVIAASDAALLADIVVMGSKAPVASSITTGSRIVVTLDDNPVNSHGTPAAHGDLSDNGFDGRIHRYYGLRVTGTTLAGTVTGELTLCPGHSTLRSYPSGFKVQ